jgi:hypothetical protein
LPEIKAMSEKIHIGKLIKQKLDENDRSISWLAKKVGCDRGNLFRALLQNEIQAGLLFRISIVLEADFFAYYSDKLKDML